MNQICKKESFAKLDRISCVLCFSTLLCIEMQYNVYFMKITEVSLLAFVETATFLHNSRGIMSYRDRDQRRERSRSPDGRRGGADRGRDHFGGSRDDDRRRDGDRGRDGARDRGGRDSRDRGNSTRDNRSERTSRDEDDRRDARRERSRSRSTERRARDDRYSSIASNTRVEASSTTATAGATSLSTGVSSNKVVGATAKERAQSKAALDQARKERMALIKNITGGEAMLVLLVFVFMLIRE